MAALDADQRRHHRVAPADGVGQELALELDVLAVAELLGGPQGERHVQHVQIAAAAAEPDHLSVEGGDQVDVVRLEIAQHQGQHPETGQAERHSADHRGLTEPL